MSRKIYFIEDNFLIKQEGLIIRPCIYPIKNFKTRIVVNFVYFFRLLFCESNSIIIAPWGLFWIPAILKKIHIKNFFIISLSTDTFLSEKTINNKNKGFLNRLKFFLANTTFEFVDQYLYSSSVVKEQLSLFGVPESKLYGKYDIWIMDKYRFDNWRKFHHNFDSKDFLFIGHYYISNQKRLDIVIEAFLDLRKENKNLKLHVVGGNWDSYFTNKEIEYYESQGVIFYGFKYDIDDIVKKCGFYVHPGECEAISTAVLECMLAGLICIVSNKGGEREAVSQIGEEFVVNLSKQDFFNMMQQCLSYDNGKRDELSRHFSEIGSKYSKENAEKKINILIDNLLHNVF